MMKRTVFAALLLLSTPALFAGSAGAQTLPDPALQRAETQNAIAQQQLQTQQNNTQTQLSVQQNEIRQQQLFNSMPLSAYQQPHFYVPPAPRAATP